jgi:hypothetical protein
VVPRRPRDRPQLDGAEGYSTPMQEGAVQPARLQYSAESFIKTSPCDDTKIACRQVPVVYMTAVVGLLGSPQS